jgi:transposase InsO family protein
VLECLETLFVSRGTPEFIRSDNGSEFTARPYGSGWHGSTSRRCSSHREAPWENGYIESFNGKLRDELLDREIFSDRALAAGVQHVQTAQRLGVPTAGTRRRTVGHTECDRVKPGGGSPAIARELIVDDGPDDCPDWHLPVVRDLLEVLQPASFRRGPARLT